MGCDGLGQYTRVVSPVEVFVLFKMESNDQHTLAEQVIKTNTFWQLQILIPVLWVTCK